MTIPPKTKFWQTPTFHLACQFSAGTLILICAISAFIYWQTAIGLIKRADAVMLRDAEILVNEKQENTIHFIERRLNSKRRVIVIAALFDAQGHTLAGNLDQLPAFVPLDGKVHSLPPDETCCELINREDGRILAQSLPDGSVLVLARNVDDINILRQTVEEALLAGVVPALLIALAIGTALGRKTALWMHNVETMAQRIEKGEIWQRLPVPQSNDQTRWLVESMNRILDGITHAFDTTRNSNEHFAHDLLAPLSGIRARLERATNTFNDLDEMRNTVVLAISGLDQTVKLASALLKISTIERGHIRSHFQPVSVDHILLEVGELFSVMAEDKEVTLVVNPKIPAVILGDQDLLMEAIANLVDNAIKYTPQGGQVELYLSQDHDVTTIGIKDTGPGLPEDQHQPVMERFYRFAETAHAPGHGLGLSLVDAVVRLHHMSLNFKNANPGLIVEIISGPTHNT